MLYELRQYDVPLLTFYIERRELDKLTYTIEWVNDEKKHLLPIGLTPDSEGLSRWLKSRVIPKNREFVDQILARSGLNGSDVMGIINVCKGLSLNDSYWVVEKGFEGKFACIKAARPARQTPATSLIPNIMPPKSPRRWG